MAGQREGTNLLFACGNCLNMFADNFLGAEPDEGLQTEKNNQQIIDLAEPDKNIWQEIKRHDNVGQQEDE